MEKLRAAGLYMSSLVPIKGTMIERYNQCLAVLGVEPTKLKSISIDSIGWSPEVAEEKNNNFYLNHGGANPYGIILSPKQEGAPVYVPFHSFDRSLVDLFFSENKAAISDITANSGIIINLDQNIDAFYEPSDLIDYDVVTVGYQILDELDREQLKQKNLVAKMYEGNNCLNMNLHSKILASANKFGDLRTRKLQLKEVDYQTTSFYTKAFGGVFVLRSSAHNHLLIFESLEEMNKYQHSYDVVHIEDDSLLGTLTERGFLHFNLSLLDDERIDRISQYIFSQYLKADSHSISEIFSTKTLYQKYLNQLDISERNAVMGPRKFVEKVNNGHQPDRENYFNEDIFAALHSPAIPELDMLLWILICRIQPSDPYLTYYYDKELFYQEFASYDNSYQDWIIQVIKSRISRPKNN